MTYEAGPDYDPIFDRSYLLQLLSEVRPDATLEEFMAYANGPERQLAELLSEAQLAGEVAIYQDEFNTGIVCLTPLGACRAGVKLSDDHPPQWLRIEDETSPAATAREAGCVLFTDLDTIDESGRVVSFLAAQQDHKDVEPMVVLTNLESFAERLVADRRLENGRLVPRQAAFIFLGIGDAWPAGAAFRATPDTPNAKTLQEQYTVCPFCRKFPAGAPCSACGRTVPRTCPVCSRRKKRGPELCLWCSRSGLDFVLPPAAPVMAVRVPKSKLPRRKPSPYRKVKATTKKSKIA